MLFVLLLLVCYGCLAESQPPNLKILIHVPRTLLDSSSSSDSNCPSQHSIDLLDKEIRKTRHITNSNYPLQLWKCTGPWWTSMLNINMADPGNSCQANWRLHEANWRLHEQPARRCGRKSEERYSCVLFKIFYTSSSSFT